MRQLHSSSGKDLVEMIEGTRRGINQHGSHRKPGVHHPASMAQ
jgi:hypothetical protein